ncbi:hypothetical protein DFS33DRAFT_592234 [Desarmillaria ectypa]|nr:hypothetical protein DFS33DRAFT_592234 [Desarmillaria ectypa]
MSRNNVSQTIHNFIRSIVPGQEPHDSPQLPQPEVPANDAAVDAAPQPLTVQNVESMDIDVPPSSSQDDDNDSMPPLNDISESDESDEDFSQSDTSMDADELEVQLQAISDEQVSESGLQPPPQPPTSPNTPAASPSRSSTRRARVETDEDQDRDRRHPSQRVQVDNSTLVTANGPQPAQPLPRIHLPFRSGPGVPPGAAANPDTFRIWQHFMQGIPGPPNAAGAPPNNAQAPPAGQPQNGQAGHPMLGLFGITIDLGADPHVHAHPPPNPTPGQPLHPHQHMPPPMFNLPTGFVNVGDGNAFAELLARFGGMMGGPEYEQEDPERAKRLVNGLEEVPIGLIRRLERVGAVGSKDSDAVSGSGGDSDCAICWDRLLDGDGNQFGKEEESSKEDAPSSSDAAQSLPEASPATSSSTTEETLKHDSLSESKTFASSSPQPSHPKIVALPCAHVFHASCLIPWFSRPRQTTCPTCRFNVDPENLTYVRRRRTPRRAPAPANAPTASTATSNERMTPFVDADTPTAINTPATESVPPPPVNAGAGPATGIGGHGVDIPRNSIFTQALLNTLMGMQPTAAAGTGTGTAHAPTAPSEATPEQPGAPNPNAFTDALRNGRPLPQISAADLVNLFMAGYPPVSGTNVPAQGPAPLNVLPNPTSGVATSQGATPSNDNDLPPLEPIDALLPDAAAPTANAQPAPAPGHQQGVPLNHGQRPDGQDEGFVTIGFDMIFGPAPGEGGADDVVMGDNIDLHGEFDLADAFEDHMNQFDQAMHGTPPSSAT